MLVLFSSNHHTELISLLPYLSNHIYWALTVCQFLCSTLKIQRCIWTDRVSMVLHLREPDSPTLARIPQVCRQLSAFLGPVPLWLTLGYIQPKPWPRLPHHSPVCGTIVAFPSLWAVRSDSLSGYKAPTTHSWLIQWTLITVFPTSLPQFSLWELPSVAGPFHPNYPSSRFLLLHQLLWAECPSHTM